MKESSLRNIPVRHDRRACLGGLVPFSTVDWPDRLTATLFVSGCPWRCHYCHNPHLQRRTTHIQWEDALSFLQSRQGLLDGVVFAGGEPLMEVELPSMVRAIRKLGFEIGLHTAGIYPDRLHAILPDLAWVGLDIKTLPERYDQLTGRAGSWTPVSSCLQQLREWARRTGQPYECRTTWSEDWLSQPKLLELAAMLKNEGVQTYAVQRFRSAPDREPVDRLLPQTEAVLNALFTSYTLR